MLAPALLLLATTMPDIGTSPIAEEGTVHTWVELGNDDDGIGWYDKTFEDTILHERKAYPVVLTRFVIRIEQPEQVGDMLLAVDCEGKSMATVAAWLKNEDRLIEYYDLPEGLVFDFTEPPFYPEDIILFQQACGKGWKP